MQGKVNVDQRRSIAMEVHSRACRGEVRLPVEPPNARALLDPNVAPNQLLVLWTFPVTVRSATAESAAQRNDLVANLAHRVFMAHAAPGSKTEAFAHKLTASGKPLLTLDSPANGNLVEMGAEVARLEKVGDFVYGLTGSTDWRCQNAGSL